MGHHHTLCTTPRTLYNPRFDTMGVEKIIHEQGQGDAVQKGQTVTIAYTGWGKVENSNWEKGNKYDTACKCVSLTELPCAGSIPRSTATKISLFPSALAG